MSAKKKTGSVKGKPKTAKAAPKVVRKKVAKQPKPRKTEKPAKEEKVETEEKIEKAEKVEEPAKVHEVISRPPVPVPAVNVRHQASMKMRRARGYSIGEITSAGITLISASRWRVPFDKRRKSLLSENAEKLKAWLKSPKEGGSSSSGRKARTRKRE